MKKWRFGVLIILVVLGSIVLPVASVQNGKIAFTSNPDGNNEIYVMNADGTGQTCLTNNPASDRQPAWSPNGTKIAFISDRDGNGEVYVMNADGTDQNRITTNTANESLPAWSPDGMKIAFTSDRDGNGEIYVMNADGTGQTLLTNNPAFDEDPTWSPNGTKIAFTSGRSGNGEIYVMNTDGSGQSKFTSCLESVEFGATCSQPDWSPEGSKIAYKWHFGAEADIIHTVNTNGTGDTVISTNGHGKDPAWSPDGTKIVYRSDEWQLSAWYEIFVTNVDGSGWTQLTNDTSVHTTPAWGCVPTTTPVAGFTANPLNGVSPLSVSFTDASENTPTSWSWSFKNVTGNNTQVWFSTGQNPHYTFGIGNFSMVLNASNSAGYNLSTQVTFINVTAGPVTSTIGVFRPSARQFIFNTAPITRTTFGLNTDIPITGDWNGDDITDIGVFRPSARQFIFNTSPVSRITFGLNTDIPITGDWDGDFVTDIGVFRPSARQFIFNTVPITRINFGQSTDIPITGDWNGDGRTDIGVFRPSTRQFIFNTASITRTTYGMSSDIPITGDWNGDDITDIGVFRPSARQFIFNTSPITRTTFGLPTDIPIYREMGLIFFTAVIFAICWQISRDRVCFTMAIIFFERSALTHIQPHGTKKQIHPFYRYAASLHRILGTEWIFIG